jgi:allantoate deiminase
MSYLQRATSIMDRLQTLAAISEDVNCITRTFGTAAFIAGSKKVMQWMQEAGLDTHIDNIGNVRGRWETGAARTLVIASHIDTVINAGRFDGPLGVLMGIDIVQALKGTAIPFNIEVIAFSDEEGVRFHTTYLGSKAVTGAFDKHLLEKEDQAGITLKEAIETMGGDISGMHEDVIHNWQGYFEIHIEQGPVLYESNIPIAIVSAIAGQKRVAIRFKGMAGHAGTVPMNGRQDALCGAAAFILAVEEYARLHEIVATVGYLQVSNAASNVIPGEVTCSLDIRSADILTLDTAYIALQKIAADICGQRLLNFEWQLIQESKPVTCDKVMNALLRQAITASGYETVQLVSGAGHDAVPISAVSPVCMLFVKCFKGISHHPSENVDVEDIAAALKVSDQFMLNLIHY